MKAEYIKSILTNEVMNAVNKILAEAMVNPSIILRTFSAIEKTIKESELIKGE